MLVDARWPPPDPPPRRGRPDFPWTQLKWPALVVLFLVGGYLTPPLVGFLCLCAALYCFAECARYLRPTVGGMRDYKQ
jgi:hypothetical protein